MPSRTVRSSRTNSVIGRSPCVAMASRSTRLLDRPFLISRTVAKIRPQTGPAVGPLFHHEHMEVGWLTPRRPAAGGFVPRLPRYVSVLKSPRTPDSTRCVPDVWIRVLGSAAGGGFPQWNCSCPNCSGVRAGTVPARTRSQASVAVSADRREWLLVNATPDIGTQLARLVDPAAGIRRNPIVAA